MRKMAATVGLCLIITLASAQVKNAGCQLRLSEPISSNDLTWQNDSIKVQFEFNEMNYFVCLSVWNKTQETISIDWDKFLMIQGKASYPILFDDTVLLQKDQSKGKSQIASGTMIWKNISPVSNVEYNIELYTKKDVKKFGSRQIGFIIPIVSRDQTTEYKFTIDVTM